MRASSSSLIIMMQSALLMSFFVFVIIDIVVISIDVIVVIIIAAPTSLLEIRKNILSITGHPAASGLLPAKARKSLPAFSSGRQYSSKAWSRWPSRSLELSTFKQTDQARMLVLLHNMGASGLASMDLEAGQCFKISQHDRRELIIFLTKELEKIFYLWNTYGRILTWSSCQMRRPGFLSASKWIWNLPMSYRSK